MAKAATPKPPAGLGKAGRALWRSIQNDLEDGWALDARELHLLARACRTETTSAASTRLWTGMERPSKAAVARSRFTPPWSRLGSFASSSFAF